MRNTGRTFISPVSKTQQESQKSYKVSRLKDLDTSEVWILIESIENELKTHSLFYSRRQLKGLIRRHTDLSTELDNRISEDEANCEFYGKSYINGIVPNFHPWSTPENPIIIDKDIESCRKNDENPNRKSFCKVPNSPANGFKRLHIPNPMNKIRTDRSGIREAREREYLKTHR